MSQELILFLATFPLHRLSHYVQIYPLNVYLITDTSMYICILECIPMHTYVYEDVSVCHFSDAVKWVPLADWTTGKAPEDQRAEGHAAGPKERLLGLGDQVFSEWTWPNSHEQPPDSDKHLTLGNTCWSHAGHMLPVFSPSSIFVVSHIPAFAWHCKHTVATFLPLHHGISRLQPGPRLAYAADIRFRARSGYVTHLDLGLPATWSQCRRPVENVRVLVDHLVIERGWWSVVRTHHGQPNQQPQAPL